MEKLNSAIAALVCFSVFICVFLGFYLISLTGWPWDIIGYSVVSLTDPDWQWIYVSALIIYFILLFVACVLNRDYSFSVDLSVLAFSIFVLIGFFLDEKKGGASIDLLILLTSILFARTFVSWLRSSGVSFDIVLLGLCMALIFVALFHPFEFPEYFYGGLVRWRGPFGSPNTFGLVLSVGIICLMALGRSAREHRFMGEHRKLSLIIKFLVGFLVLILLYCNYRSFSRGAWLAVACGLLYYLSDGAFLTLIRRIFKIKLPLILVGFPAVVLCFFIADDVLLIKRLASFFDSTDVSRQNRIDMWISLLKVMRDMPIRGSGFSDLVSCIQVSYMPSHMRTAGAIYTNDFLRIGAGLGIPALLALISIFLIIFKRLLSSEICLIPKVYFYAKASVCCIIVFAVGFWFDGGMFDFSTSFLFWFFIFVSRGPDFDMYAYSCK